MWLPFLPPSVGLTGLLENTPPENNIEKEGGQKLARVSTIMTGIVDGQLDGEQKMAYFCFSFFSLNSSSFFLK